MRLTLHGVLLTVGMMLFGYLFITPARADEWDKQTTFQFSQPVEVPGHVLVPGNYMFKLLDSPSDRDIVEIYRVDHRGMDHLITTVMAIPAYRVQTPDHTIVTFEERHSNNPEALHKWFYPGDNFGWEFVYPKSETLQVASSTASAPAPAPPTAVTPPPAPQPAAATPAPSTTTEQQNTEVAQNQPAPAPSVTPPASSNQSSANRELPKTASDLPLVALLGILFLGSGLALLLTPKRRGI